MRSCVRCKCMYEAQDMMGALCPFCAQQLRPTPAQEEKEMENAVHIDGCWCGACEKKRTDATRTADLRERWDRAFYAALTGLAGIGGLADVETAYHAQQIADSTIRRHADMMASRDAAIAEVVG